MYRSGFEIYRSGFEFYTLARDPVLSSIDESRSVRSENQLYRSDFETSGNETSRNETYMNPLLDNFIIFCIHHLSPRLSKQEFTKYIVWYIRK